MRTRGRVEHRAYRDRKLRSLPTASDMSGQVYMLGQVVMIGRPAPGRQAREASPVE